MELTDHELIARAVAHLDHDAFGVLVSRYQSPVRSWLRRMTGGNEALADDIAQETFIRVYEQLGTFRGQGKFSAWVFIIAYNQFRNALRRGHPLVQLDDDLAETLVAPSESTEVVSLRADLEEAMNTLTLEQRAGITLFYQQGLTHEEIAAVMDWPLGTVKTNILRGKERLQRYFQKHDAINR